jgi:hypothetical protein
MKKLGQFIWELLLDIGEHRKKQFMKRGYSMWY